MAKPTISSPFRWRPSILHFMPGCPIIWSSNINHRKNDEFGKKSGYKCNKLARLEFRKYNLGKPHITQMWFQPDFYQTAFQQTLWGTYFFRLKLLYILPPIRKWTHQSQLITYLARCVPPIVWAYPSLKVSKGRKEACYQCDNVSQSILSHWTVRVKRITSD